MKKVVVPWLLVAVLSSITSVCMAQAHTYDWQCRLTKDRKVMPTEGHNCPGCLADDQAKTKKEKEEAERKREKDKREAEEARVKAAQAAIQHQVELDEKRKKEEDSRIFIGLGNGGNANNTNDNSDNKSNKNNASTNEKRTLTEQMEDINSSKNNASSNATQSSSERTSTSSQNSSDGEQSESSSNNTTQESKPNSNANNWRVESSAKDLSQGRNLAQEGAADNDVEKMKQAKELLEKSNKTLYNPNTKKEIKRLETQIVTTEAITTIAAISSEFDMPFYGTYGQFSESDNGGDYIAQFGLWNDQGRKDLRLNFDVGVAFGNFPEASYVRQFAPENATPYTNTQKTGKIRFGSLLLGARLDYVTEDLFGIYVKADLGLVWGEIKDDQHIGHPRLKAFQMLPFVQTGLSLRLGDMVFTAGIGYLAFPLEVEENANGYEYNERLRKYVDFTADGLIEKETGGLFWTVGLGISF
jgi:hypothetical protein